MATDEVTDEVTDEHEGSVYRWGCRTDDTPKQRQRIDTSPPAEPSPGT